MIGLAAASLAFGALGQGTISLDNSGATGRICLDAPGNYYSGPIGLEVWELAGTTVPSALRGPLNGDLADAYLPDFGFRLEATFINQTAIGGVIKLGTVALPDVMPGGSRVVLGLLAWNTSDASIAAIPPFKPWASGLILFVTPTGDPMSSPPVSPPSLSSSWTSDFILYSFLPEPSPVALAGIGMAFWLLLGRRHKRHVQ